MSSKRTLIPNKSVHAGSLSICGSYYTINWDMNLLDTFRIHFPFRSVLTAELIRLIIVKSNIYLITLQLTHLTVFCVGFGKLSLTFSSATTIIWSIPGSWLTDTDVLLCLSGKLSIISIIFHFILTTSEMPPLKKIFLCV